MGAAVHERVLRLHSELRVGSVLMLQKVWFVALRCCVLQLLIHCILTSTHAWSRRLRAYGMQVSVLKLSSELRYLIITDQNVVQVQF